MKLNGMAGTGSGKLGSQVYASVAGEQIVRQYQPKVSNPNTSAQVNQRARMKLMSQLSAAMASTIVIPRQGMQSTRNLFSKKNFSLIQAVNGQALIFLENLQFTNGNAALPRVGMERVEGDKLHVYLQASAASSVDRVVYNIYARNEEGELMLAKSLVVSQAGEDGVFDAEVDDIESDLYVYAYGMKDTNARAKATYGNYHVESGEDIAKLFMQRKLSTSDYQFTETSGNSITIDETATADVPEGSVLVRFHIVGDGAIRLNSAAGAVQKSPLVKARGSQLKWFAAAAPEYYFQEWREGTPGESTKISTSNPLTFSVWGDTNVVAVFNKPSSNADTIGGLE